MARTRKAPSQTYAAQFARTVRAPGAPIVATVERDPSRCLYTVHAECHGAEPIEHYAPGPVRAGKLAARAVDRLAGRALA